MYSRQSTSRSRLRKLLTTLPLLLSVLTVMVTYMYSGWIGQTDRITEYFDHILQAQNKWGFRKMRAEVSVAQQAIVTQLKELIKKNGIALSIEEYRPNKTMGRKEERIAAILELGMTTCRCGTTVVETPNFLKRN